MSKHDQFPVRTSVMLSHLLTPLSDDTEPAKVVILLGRTGVGKSSLLEDLTNTEGHAQDSIDPGKSIRFSGPVEHCSKRPLVTTEYQLELAELDRQRFFFMDTPGFDEGSEKTLFREILRGIQDFQNKARIVGILHVSKITNPRLEKWDLKLLEFVQALCGRPFYPQITFVTTHWTATRDSYKQKYNSILGDRRERLTKVFETSIRTYQHGRGLETSHLDTAEFLDWDESRTEIAQHAKAMIVQRYGDLTAFAPQIVRELGEGVNMYETAAARYLGLSPPPGTGARTSNPAPGGHDSGSEQAHHGFTSDSTNSQSQSTPRAAPTSCETNEGPSWDKIATTLFNRAAGMALDHLLGSSSSPSSPSSHPFGGSIPSYGGGGGGGSFTFRRGSSALQIYWGSDPDQTKRALTIPLDPNSVVDTFKFLGLDPSLASRTTYAQGLGVQGTPGSASWCTDLNAAMKSKHGML